MNTTPSSTPEMTSAYRYLNSPLLRPIPLPIYSQTPPRAFTPDRHLPTYCQTPPRLFTSTRIGTNNEMEQEREVLPSAIDAHTVPIVVARTTDSNEPRDCRLALLKRAADQGFSEAQSALAECYEFGWGVQQDSSAAHSWYQKAADQGDSRAQFRLGRAYEQGKWGGDCQQAARLLLQSCLSPGGQTIDASDLGFDKLIKFVPTLFRECNAFSQVKTLNLALAEIDNEGVLAIVQLIQENQVIEVLDLENNWFDSTGLDAIAHALHANLVLKKLVVGNGGFRQSIRADIKLSLKKNSNIAALKKAAHANPIKGSKDLPTELIPLIENFLIEIDQKPIGVQQTRKQTQSRLNALRQSVYYGSSIRPSE